MELVRLSLALASAVFLAMAQGTVSLSITPHPTRGTSSIISPSFAGFVIEPSNLYSFTVGSENNDLTTNLLENFANYTGVPLHIRLGGNAEDYIIYDESTSRYLVDNNPGTVG